MNIINRRADCLRRFRSIAEAALGIGGQYGERAPIRNGKAVACYSNAGASYDLQAASRSTATPCSS